jgi:hypothetical protein
MKLAVVASGWHFPSSFYEMVAKQKLPKGWEMDLFVVAHRTPEQAYQEKTNKDFEGERAYLDERLYNVKDGETLGITQTFIEDICGFKYIQKPNTVGDWGNSNQWLEEHNYEDYDLLLFTHDDNLILTDRWFKDVITDKSFKEWDILANTVGMPPGWIRGSCEFFKPSVLKKMGGKFDLSEVTLDRTGETTVSEDTHELYDWNKTVDPLMRFIEANDIKLGFLAPGYRFSMYVLEGERGYISNTHGANTAVEDENLKIIKENGLI